ncbi:hypothetical protein [Hydrogenophaga atypica]|uniref:hypothetical protein n=1 Tax=Hydrogenophaga atypica TaxID=249409 RepID=UPI0036D2696C
MIISNMTVDLGNGFAVVNPVRWGNEAQCDVLAAPGTLSLGPRDSLFRRFGFRRNGQSTALIWFWGYFFQL